MAKKPRETNTLAELVEKMLQHPRVNQVLLGMVLALLLVVYMQGK